MDSYFIGGYINNNKDYEFQAFINVGGRKQFQRDIGYDEEKLGKLLKEQEVKNQKTVDQIIKNEHLDKSEYEAEPPLFFLSGSLDQIRLYGVIKINILTIIKGQEYFEKSLHNIQKVSITNTKINNTCFFVYIID